MPDPTDEITFESFSMLAALAALTERVRIGHMVVCTGFRNPALTAKLSSTLDVISGGRFELGIGAGWKEDEWRAYGYGFPPLASGWRRSATISRSSPRMLEPGRATFEGRLASVRDAINVPKGIQQPRIPIIVGGNGERVTAGYAIRYADELNYVFLDAPELIERMASVRERCAEEGRDPATLRFSLYTRDEAVRDAGQARIDYLAELAGDRARPDRLLPDPLVADDRRAGELRRRLRGGRDHPGGCGGGGAGRLSGPNRRHGP